MGLKYFDDLQKRMPREEVSEIVKIVADRIEELADVKRVFEVICCGSYRRYKNFFRVTLTFSKRKNYLRRYWHSSYEKGWKADHKLFVDLGQEVEKQPILKLTFLSSLEDTLLTDHLAMPKPGTYGNETYMGICRNGGLYRRIDIKVIFLSFSD